MDSYTLKFEGRIHLDKLLKMLQYNKCLAITMDIILLRLVVVPTAEILP